MPNPITADELAGRLNIAIERYGPESFAPVIDDSDWLYIIAALRLAEAGQPKREWVEHEQYPGAFALSYQEGLLCLGVIYHGPLDVDTGPFRWFAGKEDDIPNYEPTLAAAKRAVEKAVLHA